MIFVKNIKEGRKNRLDVQFKNIIELDNHLGNSSSLRTSGLVRILGKISILGSMLRNLNLTLGNHIKRSVPAIHVIAKNISPMYVHSEVGNQPITSCLMNALLFQQILIMTVMILFLVFSLM